MILKSFCSVRNLDQTNYGLQRISSLPESIYKFNLVLEEPKPISRNEYKLFYDEKSKVLYLRYLSQEMPTDYDYWQQAKVGILAHANFRGFRPLLEKVKSRKQLYFHVIKFNDSFPEFHLLEGTDDNERDIGENIKMIFIPKPAFVKRCADVEEVIQKLKKYFHEYADYISGSRFRVRTDAYKLNTKKELVYVDNSDWSGVVLGYMNGRKALNDFQIPDMSDAE